MEKAPEFDPVITNLSVWKVATTILKQHSKEIVVVFHSLPHHYTEEISPTESTASISKNGDCIRRGLDQ